MRLAALCLLLLAWLVGPLPAQPLVGVVDEALVSPHEWAKGPAWGAQACMAAFAAQGFGTRLLGAADLTPQGLAQVQVVAIPGDHVYPERGGWGGPVLGALAELVRAGGIYVMPIGVSHYVARDLESGRRDSGHWGPDPLGLTFETAGGGGPLALTRQGRALGLPSPSQVSEAPLRALRLGGKAAVLAWDARYLPALVAVPVGRGWVIHSGCGEQMTEALAGWWYAAAAKAARAAGEGRLRALTMTETLQAEGLAGLPLDDLDRRAFRPGPGPLDSPSVTVRLQPGPAPRATPSRPRVRLALDGTWEMVGRDPGRGSEADLLAEAPWPGAIPARVPGSVHSALLEAGSIPDPMVGLNADLAREASYREWWLRRRFDWPKALQGGRLVFSGVDYSCTVWLNGVRLGRHEGAFGGPEYEVGPLLREHNTLVVRLDPVPAEWQLVLKTNVVYGWHYVNLPSLGIWRPVTLEGEAAVRLEHPFVATRDARGGVVDLCLVLGGQGRWRGRLTGSVALETGRAPACHFTYPVSGTGRRTLHLRMTIPHPQLWWPVDLGQPTLYRLELRFVPEGAGIPDSYGTLFGLRTIRTAPLPEGPLPHRYRWTFIINGRPVFLKGANWCILDPLLRLSPARYQRFLSLARDQHVQVLRAWGGGLVETDEFYALCDRLGVMVYQEFPITWQRREVLSPSVVDEAVVRSVLRLRNHPSLLMWGGGNEHSGQGPVIEQIGRLCLELDGTRPFHRTDPYGGSQHNYDVYWGGQPLDRNLSLSAPFLGEFGLSSPPNLESVLRYLPEAERNLWPPPEGGSFLRHTPTYERRHLEIMSRYGGEFADPGSMAGLITGMQLAQATGLRHTLELARTRWPEATGAIYYKLTDVYPACAWSTVDWYGVPKIAYWAVQDAFAPLHACALFEKLSVPAGEGLALPIYLLDDAARLRGPWKVSARAYDGALAEVARRKFAGSGAVGRVRRLGELAVAPERAGAVPLLVVVEVRQAGGVADRTWYWLNYAARPGCLFALPRTELQVSRRPGEVTIRNVGRVPAVGVQVVSGQPERLRVEDGYFWLDPGEQRRLAVQGDQAGLAVAAWNASPQSDKGGQR